MKINIDFDLSFIIYNKVFLSICGALISLFILYIYKCIIICNKINKWSYIKLFILNFIIVYVILSIYDLKISNKKEINDNIKIDTLSDLED